MREFNFVHEDVLLKDIEAIFGPLEEDEENIIFQDEFMMEDIWVKAGLFPSKSQARKNGHSGPIQKGFQDLWKKKKTLRVTILNVWDDM